jgi:hypothetical protein
VARNKVREIRLRNWATRLGLSLHKSRARRWSIDNHQEYMIMDPSKNKIVCGQRYDLDLDDVEKFLEEYEVKLKSS